jgi:hypothetical protein
VKGERTLNSNDCRADLSIPRPKISVTDSAPSAWSMVALALSIALFRLAHHVGNRLKLKHRSQHDLNDRSTPSWLLPLNELHPRLFLQKNDGRRISERPGAILHMLTGKRRKSRYNINESMKRSALIAAMLQFISPTSLDVPNKFKVLLRRDIYHLPIAVCLPLGYSRPGSSRPTSPNCQNSSMSRLAGDMHSTAVPLVSQPR